MEAVCLSVRHTINPLFIYFHLQVFIAMSLIWYKDSGFCYTIYPGPLLDFSWIACCCPVIWKSCTFGPAVLVPSLDPADYRWGWCWGEQVIPWFWAWVVARLVNGQLSLTLTTMVSSPALPWLVHSLQWWAWGRASFPALCSQALLRLYHQAQLYCVAQTRCGGHSPECCSWWEVETALPLLWLQGQLFHHLRHRGLVRENLSSSHT